MIEFIGTLPVLLVRQIPTQEGLDRELSSQLSILSGQRVFESGHRLSMRSKKLPSSDEDANSRRYSGNTNQWITHKELLFFSFGG